MPSTRKLRTLLLGILALVLATASLLTVPASAQAAPAAPRALSPGGGASISGAPTLQWGRVTGAASYDVEVSSSPTFASVVYSVDNTANRRAVPTVALPPGDVHWRVRSVSASGQMSGWATTVLSVSRSAGPTPVSPADGDVLQQPFNPVVLNWHPVSGVQSYELEVDTASDFVEPGVVRDIQTTSYLIQNPQPTTTFHWRVRGVYAGGSVTEWSTARSYSIPGLPQVASDSVTPADGSDLVEDVVLDWDAVPGARDYDVRVSTDRDFSPSSTVYSATVVSTRYSPSVTYDNNQYYWQVRARDVRGNVRPWTDVQAIPLRTFERDWPDKPEVKSPLNSADQPPLAAGDPFYFQWGPVDHASHYELQLGTSLQFSPGTFTSCFTRAATYTPTGPVPSPPNGGECMPVPGRTYYWRVRGLDGPNGENDEGGVLGRWSDIHTFEYQPSRVRVTAPADGETVPIPTLRWEAAQDAEKYRVVVTDNNGATQSATTHSLSWTPSTKLDPANGPFRWYVVAIDHNGVAAPAPTPASQRTFKLSGTPAFGLPALTPAEPSATSTHARFPALAWQPHAQATSYRLYVGRVGSDTVRVVTTTQYPAATDTDAVPALQPGRYRWYVEAYQDGQLLGEGAESTFEVVDLAPVTGQQVALSGLDHAARSCDNWLDAADPEQRICRNLRQTPVLDWDPVPNASHYLIYLFHDRALTNDVFDGVRYVATQNTRWTPRTLLPESQAGDAYYWFVRPCKAASVCAPDPLSATHAFDKRSNPVEPLFTEPEHDPTPADELTMHWRDYLESNAERPDPTGAQVTVEARNYWVQVASDSTFANVLHEKVVDQTTYTPFNVTFPEGPLFWRVRAIDGSENELVWSDPVAVTKSSGTPNLTAPDSGVTTDGTPFLRWTPMSFASRYEVEISTDRLFPMAARVLLATSNQSAYSLREQLRAGTTYWWRVRTLDALEKYRGDWSTARSFRVSAHAPTLRSPAAGAYVEPDESYFTWRSVPGATSYVYELEHASQGSLGTAVTYAQAYAVRSLLPQGSYRWRVTARDASDRALDLSAWRGFMVDTVRPRVTSRSPGRRVSRTSNVEVTFSERVHRVSRFTLRLYPAGSGSPVAANVTQSNRGRTWTLNPSRRLRAGGRYSVRLSSRIADSAGNALRPTSWQVTTGRR